MGTVPPSGPASRRPSGYINVELVGGPMDGTEVTVSTQSNTLIVAIRNGEATPVLAATGVRFAEYARKSCSTRRFYFKRYREDFGP